MFSKDIYNINIVSEKLLATPFEVKEKLPLDAETQEFIVSSRKTLEQILDRQDKRIFLIVGPCSIHDTEVALDYARRLKVLAEKVKDTFFVVMRVYFEKPRTTVGWKGFINDPYLNGTFRLEEGILKSRELLLKIAQLGIPAATEALDPVMPQYYHDLISWSAIGARTTESQPHRQLSSGLSTPVAFKNGTDGNIQVAINALESVRSPHHFIGITRHGQINILQTAGNKYPHVMLRGGMQPNYDTVSIALCEKELEAAGLPVNITVDCSHGNSKKDHTLQPLVFDSCTTQIAEGNKSIVGLMLESNINAGNQSIPDNISQLKYGVSVTDACLDWGTTEEIILKAQEKLKNVLPKR